MRYTRVLNASHGPRYIRHAPPLPPNVGMASKVISKTIGAVAIFWILYRVKNDGMVMLVSILLVNPSLGVITNNVTGTQTSLGSLIRCIFTPTAPQLSVFILFIELIYIRSTLHICTQFVLLIRIILVSCQFNVVVYKTITEWPLCCIDLSIA